MARQLQGKGRLTLKLKEEKRQLHSSFTKKDDHTAAARKGRAAQRLQE
jgi:hypothetical protein